MYLNFPIKPSARTPTHHPKVLISCFSPAEEPRVSAQKNCLEITFGVSDAREAFQTHRRSSTKTFRGMSAPSNNYQTGINFKEPGCYSESHPAIITPRHVTNRR
jgi:hypothetical protein